MNVYKDFPLSRVLWYRIGGTARYMLEASSPEGVLRIAEFIHRHHIDRTFVIGLGSNLIFSDEYYDGAVVRIVDDDGDSVRLTPDGLVEAYGGAVLDSVIRFALDRGLTGLEWAGGLPGTAGAGVRGNVGAFGGEIRDSFVDGEIMHVCDGAADVTRVTQSDLTFSYRYSRLVPDRQAVVIRARFRLQPADATGVEQARRTYAGNIEYRRARHPLEYPNCGSVFKNIHRREQVERILSVWPDIADKVARDWHGKVSMGYIIQRLGFQGLQIGGAQVSTKHANFIVNAGGACARDVREIIRRIQAAVHDTFGFTPDVEVQIVE